MENYELKIFFFGNSCFHEKQLTLFRLATHFGTYANGVDPVQTPHNAASELGQNCLLTRISMQNTINVKTFTRTH